MNKFDIAVKLGLLIGSLSSASVASAHSPDGQSYRAAVFSSFNTQFSSCFVFDRLGTLTVQGYGPEVYRHDELNTQPEAWQATPSSSPIPSGFILSFHGTVGGNTGQIISGNAMSEFGDTFIFQGVVDPTCATQAARTAGAVSPFRKH